MASALLRRPCGVLASATASLSLSGRRDTSSPVQDWRGAPPEYACLRDGSSFQQSSSSWWAPLLTGSSGTAVACEEDASGPVKTLVRKKSKIITAESWSQNQSDISKHVKFEDLLTQSELFHSCPKHIIQRLADESGTRVFAKRGAKLISQNEINDKLFVVGHGNLVQEVNDHAVAHFGPGECVGEQAVMTSQLAKCNVLVSSSSAYLLVIDKASMAKALEEDPHLMEDMLSIVSRREVSQMGFELLTHIPSFQGCSQDFLESMANALKMVSFQKDEAAVMMDESDDKGMFFIMTGEMGVFDARGQVSTLGPNTFFGEAMLLGGAHARRTATVKALNFVEAFQLSRKDFLKVGTEYPNDLAQMKKVSRQRSAFLLSRKTSIRKKNE